MVSNHLGSVRAVTRTAQADCVAAMPGQLLRIQTGNR
jgi:hypothetical protein